MDFPRSSALAELVAVAETTSTNDELLARAASAPEFTVVVTDHQSAGRGRLGRVWVAPPGQALTSSVLLKPRLHGGEALASEGFGWLPLLAGLAMTRSVARLLPASSVSLKWPNDVLVDGRKTAGLLAELLPTFDGVVIGSGVNLAIPADELPTPVSTSLGLHCPAEDGVALAGDLLADAVLQGYLEALHQLYDAFLAVGGDASASGLLSEVSDTCSSLGQQVRVELPGGDTLVGVAIALDSTGRLVVKRSSDGAVQAVAAGDVTHLRYE